MFAMVGNAAASQADLQADGNLPALRVEGKNLVDANGKTVTTSKIRNLLSLVTDIFNTENIRTEEKLRPESIVKLNLMRVRVAYECGRDDTVKSFVAQTNLLEYLKGISTDRADLIRFAHYMEALVAFHRYFGGKEG